MSSPTRLELELVDDRIKIYELRLRAEGRKPPKLVRVGKGVSQKVVEWLLTRGTDETVPEDEEVKRELMGKK